MIIPGSILCPNNCNPPHETPLKRSICVIAEPTSVEPNSAKDLVISKTPFIKSLSTTAVDIFWKAAVTEVILASIPLIYASF